MFKDTKILKLTEPIPNDTISVRPDMDKKFQEKLKKLSKKSLNLKKVTKSSVKCIHMKDIQIQRILTSIS